MKDRWSQLSMSEKSDLMSLYIRNGIDSLEEIKKHYNSFADGGRVDNNSDKDPVLKDRKPKANFYQRLLSPFRQTISNWENRINGRNDVATHKIAWATDNDGNAIVYPDVQEINGRLYDFTDPRNKAGRWDALDRAIQTGDTIQMTPEQANFWTHHYKEFYPSFNFATGGHLYQDGGPDDPPVTNITLPEVEVKSDIAQNWVSNWLSQRKDKLQQNYLDTRNIFQKIKDNRSRNNNIVDSILDKQINGMLSMQQLVSSIPNEMFNKDNTRKVTQNKKNNWLNGDVLGITFPKSNRIYYNPNAEDFIGYTRIEDFPTTVRVHENTHALSDAYEDKHRLSPQVKLIDKKYAKYLIDYDPYYFDPNEIYSRIMELRYKTGLKPEDNVDWDWYINHQDDIKNLHLLFEDNKLINLLNEVAENNISTDTNYV